MEPSVEEDKVPDNEGFDDVPRNPDEIPNDELPDVPDTELDPGRKIVKVPD